MNVEALNRAVKDLPADRMRMHVCWGNYEGPHDHDIALEKILPNFDFRQMTQLAVGKNWSKASPEQQQELVEQFQ